MDFHQYQNKFIAYAKSYLTGNEQFDRNIRLKLAHTLRVFAFAEDICEGEHYFGSDVKTALFAALFHDVSRFEQFKLYQTYRDSELFDHGDIGAQMLIDGVFRLEELTDVEFECVVNAVKWHNKRTLPEGASVAAKTVRDADKLDVLYVILDELDDPSDPRVLYSLSTEKRFSKKVLQSVQDRVSPLHSDLETVGDFILAKVAWVYDLNTATARRIFSREGYLQRLKKHLPDGEMVDGICNDVFEYLNNMQQVL